MVVLALSESTAVSLSTALLSAMSGMLLGLIVYIWKTNISGMRKSVEDVAANVVEVAAEVREMDKSKADYTDIDKLVEEIRAEAKEAQARYVFLNETLTASVSDMRREFARASECAQKHQGLHDTHQMLARQFGEQKEMLQIIAGKVDQILEWKAFKAGEEHGRTTR